MNPTRELWLLQHRVSKGLRSRDVSEGRDPRLFKCLAGGCLGVREEVTLSKGCQ